jgi:hypothetical protein
VYINHRWNSWIYLFVIVSFLVPDLNIRRASGINPFFPVNKMVCGSETIQLYRINFTCVTTIRRCPLFSGTFNISCTAVSPFTRCWVRIMQVRLCNWPAFLPVFIYRSEVGHSPSCSFTTFNNDVSTVGSGLPCVTENTRRSQRAKNSDNIEYRSTWNPTSSGIFLVMCAPLEIAIFSDDRKQGLQSRPLLYCSIATVTKSSYDIFIKIYSCNNLLPPRP